MRAVSNWKETFRGWVHSSGVVRSPTTSQPGMCGYEAAQKANLLRGRKRLRFISTWSESTQQGSNEPIVSKLCFRLSNRRTGNPPIPGRVEAVLVSALRYLGGSLALHRSSPFCTPQQRPETRARVLLLTQYCHAPCQPPSSLGLTHPPLGPCHLLA